MTGTGRCITATTQHTQCCLWAPGTWLSDTKHSGWHRNTTYPGALWISTHCLFAGCQSGPCLDVGSQGWLWLPFSTRRDNTSRSSSTSTASSWRRAGAPTSKPYKAPCVCVSREKASPNARSTPVCPVSARQVTWKVPWEMGLAPPEGASSRERQAQC